MFDRINNIIKVCFKYNNCKLGWVAPKFGKHQLVVLIQSYDCEIYKQLMSAFDMNSIDTETF